MYLKINLPRGILVAVFFLFALISSICIQIASPDTKPVNAQNCVSVPIVMYHSFLRDESLQNDYCISPEVLENDLKYITENGYTTITVSDLIKYVQGESLPEKVVMLTFDDGFYNNYYYAFPLLKKYNCKGVLSPISSLSEQYSKENVKSPTYGYCSFEELKEMESSGLIEIANHSYNLHKTSPRLGMKQMSGESKKQYTEILKSDINKAQKLFKSNNIKEPVCVAYPYGATNELTESIVKSLGFKCTMTCEEKTNVISRDYSCLYGLGRYNRLSSESSNTFFERICT
jgi:peptidoglycan/xylan/chitin deacetylase (PgdA/CDA1 family)